MHHLYGTISTQVELRHYIRILRHYRPITTLHMLHILANPRIAALYTRCIYWPTPIYPHSTRVAYIGQPPYIRTLHVSGYPIAMSWVVIRSALAQLLDQLWPLENHATASNLGPVVRLLFSSIFEYIKLVYVYRGIILAKENRTTYSI